MAKLDSVDGVGVFVRDQKRARDFYVKKLGLKVRDWEPKWKYLELGTTKTGRDASISLWQPSKEWGSESYEAGTKAIGEVTGISFATGNLDATISNLAKKGIKVGETESDESGRLVEFQDVDGNTYFVYEERAKVRRAGLTRLDSITIASRDAKMTGEFFRRALGMRSSKIPATSFKVYRLHPGGTGLLPFTPTREMYPNPSDYESDLTHIGERTSIGFMTRDLMALQEKLMAHGVRFRQKAKREEWGGIQARFLDPDDNEYSIIQYRA